LNRNDVGEIFSFPVGVIRFSGGRRRRRRRRREGRGGYNHSNISNCAK